MGLPAPLPCGTPPYMWSLDLDDKSEAPVHAWYTLLPDGSHMLALCSRTAFTMERLMAPNNELRCPRCLQITKLINAAQ